MHVLAPWEVCKSAQQRSCRSALVIALRLAEFSQAKARAECRVIAMQAGVGVSARRRTRQYGVAWGTAVANRRNEISRSWRN